MIRDAAAIAIALGAFGALAATLRRPLIAAVGFTPGARAGCACASTRTVALPTIT